MPKQKQWAQLTWCNDGSKRWRKRYKKKLYHFRKLPNETMDESYRRCLHLWEKTKVRIDAADPTIPKTQYQPKTLRSRDFATKVLDELADIRLTLTDFEPDEPTDMPVSERVAWAEQQIADLINRVKATRPRSGLLVANQSTIEINNLPSELLAAKREVAGLKQEVREASLPVELRMSENIPWYLSQRSRSPSGTANVRRRLESFAKHFGPNRSVAEIDEGVFDSYSAWIKKQVESGKMSSVTARDYMVAVTAFIKKLYSRGRVATLPRNISDRDLQIKTESQKVEMLPVDTIKLMLSHADTDELRLWFLLHLNAGFIAGDISDLRQSEVDWQAGVITRRRTKTKAKENVPIVRYLLWDETFKLLKKLRNNDHHPDARVLVDRDGSPLQLEAIDDRHYTVKKRVIINAFEKFRERMKREKVLNPCPPIRPFRATAATLISRYAGHPGFEGLFLGHAPRSVADKHYVEPDWNGFHAALKWLGEQFGQTTKRRSK